MNDRALSDNYVSFRGFINWRNMNATIRQCALVARDIGYEYFAVQFYGECWSSDNAALTYDKHGVETNPGKCWANVGGVSTNYVYRFRQVSLVTSYFMIALSRIKCLIWFDPELACGCAVAEVIYQTRKAVSDHISKHRKES